MGLIKKEIEEKIKSVAKAIDIVNDTGIHLRRVGAEWTALSPFRADKHDGSFRVNEHKNIIYDFATGENWTPWGFLMEYEGIGYADALRRIAAMYNIYVDDEPVPKAKKYEIRLPTEARPIMRWSMDICKPFQRECYNPLLRWLRSLPISADRLEWSLKAYLIGTYPQGEMSGWTIWWQIDETGMVRTGKLMKYNEDGHRVKDCCYNGHEPTDWVHSILCRQGKWSRSKNDIETCLFGQHLLTIYPNAVVAVVESEKTAVICSATDKHHPEERIWVATGGKGGFRKITTLANQKREIQLFPDHDATDEWTKLAKQMKYERITVIGPNDQKWTEEDGPKADIGDIMVRYITHKEDTVADKVAAQLGSPDKGPVVQEMMDKLNLQITNQ